METVGLGAGSYPEPQENNKCYKFEVSITTKGIGYVFADDITKARDLINQKEYDDINIFKSDLEIEEINSLELD